MPRRKMVDARAGDLPVLITAPHGGTNTLPGVPVRSTGTRVTDQHTRELALALWELLGRVGPTPYLVAAGFDRDFVDANRPAKWAYEHPDAAPHYEAYHSAVRGFVDAIRQRWSVGALIDVHGQSGEPDVIHLGTCNGHTIAELISRSGWQAYSGVDSIGGVLRERGYRVHPATAPPAQEHPDYDGGYTVQTYGSHRTAGIDAIQLEIGRNHRREPPEFRALAENLSAAIKRFCDRYLLQT